jgi:dephospho-CoA kinase
MHTEILELIHERILRYREEAESIVAKSDPGNKYRVIFIDAPLLFETGLDKNVSEVWVIDADDETRIRRIMNGTAWEGKKSCQGSISDARDEKHRRADVILDNTGDQESLYGRSTCF